MTVSIVIIVKSDRQIENLLSILVGQVTSRKHEVIVVDASNGLLDDIKEKYPFARWVYFENKTKKNITIPEQRNSGIRLAKGNIIVFIDSDCIPYSNWLQELIEPIKKGHEYIVAGRVIFSNRNSSHNMEREKNRTKKYLDEAPTMNLAINTIVFKKIGVFDINFTCGEDVDFLWRAKSNGFKIRLNPKAVVYHELGGLSNEIRRMYEYGKARTKLYRKHTERIKLFIGNELLNVLYPLYFLCLPLTINFYWYPLLILIPIIKNKSKAPIQLIIYKTIYGLGIVKELIVPSKDLIINR